MSEYEGIETDETAVDEEPEQPIPVAAADAEDDWNDD